MPLSPIDPRAYLPSRADAEQRQRRKELEKEHSVGLTEVAVLGLIGLTLAWDIGKQVEKCEAKKEKAEAEEAEQKKNKNKNKNKRESESRSGSSRQRERSRDHRDHRDRDYDYGRDEPSTRHRSINPGYENQHHHRRAESRRDDRYRERIPPPPYDIQETRETTRVYYYDLPERFEPEGRGRSRRDSW